MRRLRMIAWALPLGLLATAARAGDGGWAVASPAAQLGRPIASPAAAAADPSAQLGRPFAVGAAPAQPDPQFRPASFAPVVRGQAPDAKPLPAGEPVASTQNWQRPADTSIGQPAAVGPAVVGPVAGGPVIGGPFEGAAPGSAECDCGGGCGCHKPILSWLHLDGLFGCHACGDGCGECVFGDGCRDCWDGCSGSDCGCGCEERNRFYVSGEYLLWWTKGDPVPPLLTLGSAGDFAAGLPAGSTVLPGSETVFGGAEYNASARSGGRLMGGVWFGDDHLLGIEGGGFFLESRSRSILLSGTAGSPIIARPIFNTVTGAPDVEFVSEPGLLSGTAAASVRNSFWGTEVNLRSNVWSDCCWNVDVIGGWRFLALDDTVNVAENITGVGPAAGFVFRSADGFATRNRFNGGQLGLAAELRKNRWTFDADAKVALGSVSETATLTGTTFSSFAGTTSTLPGGLLTLGRTGGFHRDRFAWSPDIGVKVGYNFTDHLRGFVGYDFLYLSSVARAGSLVNPAVNPNLLVGGGGPANSPFAFHGTDFWAQGVSFGLEFRY